MKRRRLIMLSKFWENYGGGLFIIVVLFLVYLGSYLIICQETGSLQCNDSYCLFNTVPPSEVHSEYYQGIGADKIHYNSETGNHLHDI